MNAHALQPAYLADREIAFMLGRKAAWFRKHRADLMREGFPPKDKVIGLTLRADVEAWIAKRRIVSDAVAVTKAVTITTDTTPAILKEKPHAF